MKKLYINTGEFDAVFNDLKDSFSGKLTAKNNDYSLEINSKWTKGSIRGTRFDDKVLFMHFDLEFLQKSEQQIIIGIFYVVNLRAFHFDRNQIAFTQKISEFVANKT